MRRRSVRLIAAVALAISGTALTVVFAQTDPAPSFAAANLSPAGVRSIAANCAGCHGSNGNSAGGAIAGLAGMDKEYFAEQMRLFKAGKREATVMQQIAKGFGDAEFAALGGFFASQKKPAR